MKLSYRIILTVVVLFFLLGYIDKTFLHMNGLKTLEKTFTAKNVQIKPTLTPKQQDDKENQKGYQWAEDNDITDKAKCVGESAAFREGCKTYVDDTANDAKQDQDTQDSADQ